MLTRIAVLSVVAVALFGLLLYSQSRTEPPRVSGIIEADEIRLGSRVGGRVREVKAVEGQRTAPGKVLVELEPFDLEDRRAEAAARLAAAEAELRRLKEGFRQEEIAQAEARVARLQATVDKLRKGPRDETIEAARARLRLAEAELKLAQETFGRREDAFRRGAATEEELDQAAEQKIVAQESLAVREAELKELEEGTREEDIREAEAQLAEAQAELELKNNGYRDEEIDAAEAAVNAAGAQLAAIDSRLKELKIASPCDCVVEAVELQPGDLVGTGTPVLSLMDAGNLWMRAYVPERLLRFQVGRRLRVTIDSFPGQSFTGQVTFISRQAEFTPSNVQTPEDRAKQVFRMKVELLDGTDKLRPGMAGDVWLDVSSSDGSGNE